MCHGLGAKSGGTVSDLRLLSEQQRALFEEYVLGGLLADQGMDSFADVLSPADVGLIKAYITSRALEDRAEAAQ